MFAFFFRILVTIVIMVSMVGCGSSSPGKSSAKSYPQDGYMGMTSVNPNNPMNPGYHHYQDDTDLMKAVLAQFPEVQESRIRLRGPKADVTIFMQDGLDAAKQDEIRSAVQRALSTNMPRYKVKVLNQSK